MQVSVESTGPLERTMRVEIPEDQIATEVQNRLRNLTRTTRVQGFRPGKAPLKVIEQRFGSRVRQEVVGEAVQTSFYEAINRENLRPAGSPQIDPLTAELGRGVQYTATFEIIPEVKLVEVEKLEVTKPVCDITDENVDAMIETLRRQHRRLEPVDREARSGEVVEIDFTGKVGDEEFEGGSGKDFQVELGSGRFIEGFEDGLVGRKPGDDVRLELQFPEDYRVEKLAGKPVVFSIQVKKVLEPVLPEMDEDLFKQFGVTEGGEEMFRKEVREHMQREADSVVRNRIRDSVMEALFEAHTLELPKALVEQEVQQLRQQVESRLKAYGIEVEKAQENLNDPKLFEERARKRVTLRLVVAEVIKENGLTAEPGKVRALIEQNAQSYEDPTAIINWYYADKDRLAEVEALALEDEVIDWIAGRAQLNETNVPFDELVNKGQTEAA